MKLRSMKIEDVDKVSEIEADSFTTPWNKDAFEGSILQENYRLLVAVNDEDDSDIYGYCSFYYVMDEAEIPNVCVRRDKRKLGIGYEMLSKLLEIAKEAGVHTIYLEVRASNNAAIALYKKLGFSENGIRRDFYEKPREDALIMRCVLNA